MQQQPAPAQGNVIDQFLSLAREKQFGAGAMALALLGFVLPIASTHTPSFFGPAREYSFGLMQAGLGGVVLLAAAIALGLSPFYLRESPRNNVIAFGVAAGFFGTLFSLWFMTLLLPAMLSAFASLSIGFYAMLASFGLSTYLTVVRCYERMAAPAPAETLVGGVPA